MTTNAKQRVSYFTSRNVLLSIMVGPFLVLLSIALKVTDQGFDSVAGFGGFVILIVISAIASVTVFALLAPIASFTTNWLAQRRFSTRALITGRVFFVCMLGLAYYLIFQLPTFKPQLVLVTVIAMLLGCLLRPEKSNKLSRNRTL